MLKKTLLSEGFMDEYYLEISEDGLIISKTYCKVFHGQDVNERVKFDTCEVCGKKIFKTTHGAKKCLPCIHDMFKNVNLDEDRLSKVCIKMKAEGFSFYYRIFISGIKCNKVFTYFFADPVDIQKFAMEKHPKAKSLDIKGPFNL